MPAIKGPEYFERLLAGVHDMLDATVRIDIRTAAASFTSEIRKHTNGILADLEKHLGLKSDIELPSDLRQLFSELEFRSEAGGHRVALSQRGDGVKVRHIPVILRWLAEQANHLSAPGRPRVVTVWGYEEPENNLETRRCFQLAEFFLETSSSIQTFLTTHSPVYYSVFSGATAPDVQIVEVQLDQETGTKLRARTAGVPSDVDALHSSTGFLDFLEPHVREWKKRVDLLETRLAQGLDVKRPTVFVEGPSDKTIIQAVLKRYFPTCGHTNVVCSTSHGGGHGWVKDSLIAWQHSRGQKHAVGLFDSDAGSAQSLEEFKVIVETRAKGNQRAFKYRMKPMGLALEVTKAKVHVPVAIEELCPKEAWQKAEEEGWLDTRPKMTALYQFVETDVTFNDWIRKKLPDETLRLIATKRVRVDYKETFGKYVAGRLSDETCTFDFTPLRSLVEELLGKIEVQEMA